MKNITKYILFIFPAFYLLLGFYFRHIFGDLSLRSTDPDYMNFISGMCISTGQFDEANIDHPGSALQIILALVFRVVYLFRPTAYPYFEDAMINSDLYLSVGNLSITALLALTIYWAGHSTLRITNNYIYALTIQTSPFLINIWYEIYGRIYPELLILIPVLIIQVLLLKSLYDKNSGKTEDILLYSFALALGTSLKMTFLPFLLIPFIVLNPIRKKIQFIIFFILFFSIISLPVTLQFERYWNWMKGIFMHSGMYQSGEKNIIQMDVFMENLLKIFHDGKHFFIVLLIFLLGALILIIAKSKVPDRKKTLIRISAGLTGMVLLSMFIVGKQYALRYFIPVLLFNPFLYILNAEILKQFSLNKYILKSTYLIILIFILFNLKNRLPYIRITSEGIGKQMEARINSRNFIKTLDNKSYKIIVSQDYGCPYHEYAIMYGFCMAGGGWPGYKEKLDNIYPDTYQYFTWDNTIKYWGSEFNPHEIIKSGKPVYLYLEKNNPELYNKTIDKLFENNIGYSVSKELLFENSANGEAIMELFFSLDDNRKGKGI